MYWIFISGKVETWGGGEHSQHRAAWLPVWYHYLLWQDSDATHQRGSEPSQDHPISLRLHAATSGILEWHSYCVLINLSTSKCFPLITAWDETGFKFRSVSSALLPECPSMQQSTQISSTLSDLCANGQFLPRVRVKVWWQHLARFTDFRVVISVWMLFTKVIYSWANANHAVYNLFFPVNQPVGDRA